MLGCGVKCVRLFLLPIALSCLSRTCAIQWCVSSRNNGRWCHLCYFFRCAVRHDGGERQLLSLVWTPTCLPLASVVYLSGYLTVQVVASKRSINNSSVH